MSKVKGVLLGILFAVLIYFAIFNSHSVKVKILGEKVFFPSPLWTVVYVSVAIGIILGFLFRSRNRKTRPPSE